MEQNLSINSFMDIDMSEDEDTQYIDYQLSNYIEEEQNYENYINDLNIHYYGLQALNTTIKIFEHTGNICFFNYWTDVYNFIQLYVHEIISYRIDYENLDTIIEVFDSINYNIYEIYCLNIANSIYTLYICNS